MACFMLQTPLFLRKQQLVSNVGTSEPFWMQWWTEKSQYTHLLITSAIQSVPSHFNNCHSFQTNSNPNKMLPLATKKGNVFMIKIIIHFQISILCQDIQITCKTRVTALPRATSIVPRSWCGRCKLHYDEKD